MFDVIFLGTSASAPSIHRGLTAQVIKHDEYRFLIDCGEGTQRQILKSGLGFKRLNRILITHGHLDHILGLAGLLSTFSRWEAIEELEIYAGRWALERIRDLVFGVVLRGARPPLGIHLIEVEPGVLFEGDDFSVSAFPVHHRGPDCFGYLFEEKSRRPFLPHKAEQLGIPAGPSRFIIAGRTVLATCLKRNPGVLSFRTRRSSWVSLRVHCGVSWLLGRWFIWPMGVTFNPIRCLGPPAQVPALCMLVIRGALII
jgi:ribonuclease Z